MRLTIDPWDPSYGTSADADGMTGSGAAVDHDAEIAAERWSPISPTARSAAALVVFVDGVRRVDARVWVGDDASDGPSGSPGICASWAAGAVVCTRERAEVVTAQVGRGLFTDATGASDLVTPHGTYQARGVGDHGPDASSLALQDAMGAAEADVARIAIDGALGQVGGETAALLAVVDGPLRGRQHLASTIGLVKTHHVVYLDPGPGRVLTELAAGQRTPVFTIGSSWSRHSWYLRLPGAASSAPFAGVVRCECSGQLSMGEAVALADQSALELPRFASAPHKDSRAPQNLYPIGALERVLRRRLGDGQLMYRALRSVAV